MKADGVIAVGLMTGSPSIEADLTGPFRGPAGGRYGPGRVRFTSDITLTPSDFSSCAFAIDDVTIGIGFHWERKERQVFRGALRILERDTGLILINDVPLEEYVTSVISSEMSASCPIELLKAHAVISRSWLMGQTPGRQTQSLPLGGHGPEPPDQGSHEIIRWYGREAHPDFDVCADDHCQRYQGITKAFSPAASQAVHDTAGEMLLYDGSICDARFSKCCGGITERYSTAWDDRDVPYLESTYDGRLPMNDAPFRPAALEGWIRSDPPAYCNTRDAALIARILPGFDQETGDFYRWRVDYTPKELGELITSRLELDLGQILDLQPLARGPSGRIHRLEIIGEKGRLVIGKELEIRRALSRTHLYSSAFVVDREPDRFVLRGAGWGHGVGLCQIGAAVMSSEGRTYQEILSHYYRGTEVGKETAKT